MKPSVKKGLTALLLCLNVSGCSSAQDESSNRDIYAEIQKVCDGPDSTSVQDLFNHILDETGTYYENCFQIQQKIVEDNPVNTDPLSIESDSQESVISQWLEDEKLYQVIRSTEAKGMPAYAGLYEMGSKTTLEVSLSPQTGADVFDPSALFTVQSVNEVQNKALDGLSAQQIKYHLISEEYQPLTEFFGSDVLIPPYSKPYLYTFSCTQDNDGITFSIALKDPSGYDTACDGLDKDRKDIFSNGSIQAEEYHTDEIQYTFIMNDSGAIRSVESSKKEHFVYNGQTYDLNSGRQAYLCALTSADLEKVSDIFKKTEDGSLGRGSSLQLDLPVSNPQNFD